MFENVIGYKFVTKDLKSKNGNIQWIVDEWQKVEGKLKLCSNGLHASYTPLDSLQYTYGDRWFIIEAKGKIINGDDKFCSEEMKLTQELPIDKILVQFAILCARRCYKNYKKQYPEDKIVLAAIESAQKCLDDPSQENISAVRSAESAAWSAVWSAERSPMRSAVRSAVRSAESAVRSAAWSAMSAAWSAESAVWSAESAAWSAESAVRSAERKWQQKVLQKLIQKYIRKEQQ